MHRAVRHPPLPRIHTLWVEQQASGTCSVASQIKAFLTTLTRALLGSLAQDVTQTLLSTPFFFSSSSVTHSLPVSSLTSQPCATEQIHVLPNFKDKRLHRQGR